ncbi:NitT/TauT family transport system substrate-binding protein [Gibbsiella quercinecans]|uniref:Lipid kinase n=1 Tax=Gibbsiella quercinecans TaxID=929813 RepID=A0A250B0X5_9GAMM|nr:putative urea ABC transporter substrate-binding protein [Gibbsiella quercinecans]ATA19849.1 lipid kinase [Gibbsiella quercinecans]RLM12612.1 lipid kinase [Gibbsiella quercinecans]TCT89709.1 NitT/TauT family transport system substrate-binding protein [Gibbsiella quercinecans]
MIKFCQRLLQGTVLLSALLASLPTLASAKPSFKLCWSVYVGWMPWDYAQQHGIVKKWADKYGIDIQFVQINDYIESVNQYTAGSFDGCTMTNMDALTIPAAGGVDSTALIVGDYSNGNDGILIKGQGDMAALKGQPINLVELSVSHYLLARALEKAGMSEKDVQVVNTADADLVSAFSTPSVKAIVTWNPLLAAAKQQPDSHLLFSSAQIPGEILDLLVVNRATLQKHPELGKALTGAWYETLRTMAGDSAEAVAARSQMAQASGTDLAGFDQQLAATHLFSTPQQALAFTQNAQLKTTMQAVAEFSFRHGLLGDNAPSADVVGISTPAGTWGNAGNIKLHFDDSYLKLAAANQL